MRSLWGFSQDQHQAPAWVSLGELGFVKGTKDKAGFNDFWVRICCIPTYSIAGGGGAACDVLHFQKRLRFDFGPKTPWAGAWSALLLFDVKRGYFLHDWLYVTYKICASEISCFASQSNMQFRMGSDVTFCLCTTTEVGFANVLPGTFKTSRSSRVDEFASYTWHICQCLLAYQPKYTSTRYLTWIFIRSTGNCSKHKWLISNKPISILRNCCLSQWSEMKTYSRRVSMQKNNAA